MNQIEEKTKISRFSKLKAYLEGKYSRKTLIFFKITALCILLGIIAFLGTLFINILMFATASGDIYTFDEVGGIEGSYECAIVLGCQVFPDGTPCIMLEDRLNTGAELYFKGKVKKILVSGDHGADRYDETNAMKNFLISRGIPSEDIFMDHAGFSTYDTMKRAKEVFGVKSAVIVTQKYHLYRAMYIGKANGIELCGVSASLRGYGGQLYYDVREYAARCKDFLMVLFNRNPVFLGEKIDISGNGDVTNDK